jgi:TolB protein
VYIQPHVHPVGTHVVFWGGEAGPPRIWKADLATGEFVALTLPHVAARHPSYSFDGSRIVFAASLSSSAVGRKSRIDWAGLPEADEVTNLFVMDANGRGLRQITFGPYQDQRPCFSPDGSTVVFVSNRSGANALWSMSSDGGEPLPLLGPTNAYRPSFSVDRDWLFFYTRVDGRDRIAMVRAKGGQVSLFPNDDRGTSRGPFADPGGTHLLMHSNRDGAWGLWELPLDGSPPRSVQPPGFDAAAHATRAANGVMTFDTIRTHWVRRAASRVLGS